MLSWLLITCTQGVATEAQQGQTPVRSLQIEAPIRIIAGQPLTITVRATPSTVTTPILLLAQGTFGLYPQHQLPVDGQAHFSLTPRQTQAAGTVQLTAEAGDIEKQLEFEIIPGSAADPILPAVGPRSIVADRRHWTMVVATPRDKFLNPLFDQTAVTLLAQHPVAPGADPAQGLEVMEMRTRHLLAWGRIVSRTRAGETQISVSSGAAHSPERTVLEVPGLPVPFALAADRLSVPADGRQLIHLQSSQIMDRFGNVLVDGSSVTLLAEMGDLDRRSLPATTVDGRIYATLQAPVHPGHMTVEAWIAGVASQPLQLAFTPGPAVQPIELAVQLDGQSIMIVAGPLIGQLNQFIPDGTEVRFTITGPDGHPESNSAPADYGYASLHLHRTGLVAGTYTVAVVVGTGSGQTTFQLP